MYASLVVVNPSEIKKIAKPSTRRSKLKSFIRSYKGTAAAAEAERAIMEMDRLVANEVKMRYVTHIFSKTLDDIADWLVKPKLMN